MFSRQRLRAGVDVDIERQQRKIANIQELQEQQRRREELEAGERLARGPKNA